MAGLAALATWLFVASPSGAGEATSPVTLGVSNACASTEPPSTENALRTIFGRSGDGRPEVTRFGTDGTYEVTRCSEGGALVVRQLVIPVQTPDGPRMLATETITPTEVIEGMLPADYTAAPDLAELWKEQGNLALKTTLPPTPEPER